jgi:thioredoxin
MLKIENISQFNQLISSSDNIVVVDFHAKWCAPCKMLGPIFEQCVEEDKDIVGVKIDIDEQKEIQIEQGIRSIPTLVFFKGGKVIHTKSGMMSESNLKSLFEKLKTEHNVLEVDF